MLTPTDITLVAGHIVASNERLAAKHQATARPNLSVGAKKSAATKRPKAKKAAKTPVQRGAEVTPYLDSNDLLNVGDRIESSDNARAGIADNYTTLAAQAARNLQDVGLQRTADTASVEGNAAARGLGRSSIRDGNLDKVDADAARKAAGIRSGLALQSVQDQGATDRIRRGDSAFAITMAARAAANAAAVPRAYDEAPQQVKAQRAAGNIKKAKTQRRTK